MFSLTFRNYSFAIKKVNDQPFIKDIIRKKWVVLTPEEWVRQNIIHYLIQDKKYPIASIAVEKAIVSFEKNKRFDIVVYDNNFRPFLIMECKKQSVVLNDATLQQVLAYQSSLQCAYFFITNGNAFYGWQCQPILQAIEEIPNYLPTN